VAEFSVAEPLRPPSAVRSTKTSTDLEPANLAESDNNDLWSIANTTRLAGDVGHPSGVLPLNEPFGHTSSRAVTAPSPAALGDVKPIDPPFSKPEAENLKKDSNASPAFALLLSVNKSIGFKAVLAGVTCTCAGSIGVAMVCPGSSVKLVN